MESMSSYVGQKMNPFQVNANKMSCVLLPITIDVNEPRYLLELILNRRKCSKHEWRKKIPIILG